MLDRLPVAALAVAEDGTIMFANHACSEMLGYAPEELTAMNFSALFSALSTGESAVDAMRAFAGVVVDLKHHDGSVVRAKMSKSALLRGDDPVALATFQDLTEQLWVQEL